MNELDDRIRQALNTQMGDQQLGGEEPGLMAQVAETLKGRSRWMTLMVWVYTLIFSALSGVGIVMFFRAETIKEQIGYAGLFLFAINVTMMLKLWNWMLLNRNSVLREVKRLELLVATLVGAERK